MFQEIAEHNYYNVFPSLNSLEVKRGELRCKKIWWLHLIAAKPKFFNSHWQPYNVRMDRHLNGETVEISLSTKKIKSSLKIFVSISSFVTILFLLMSFIFWHTRTIKPEWNKNISSIQVSQFDWF